MANERKPFTDRQLAGLFIKNLINEEDSMLQNKLQQWLKCDFSTKEQIRANFVETIRSTFKEMSRLAFDIIIAYGAADISVNDLSLLSSLILLISSVSALDEAKKLSFEALGYLCEALDMSASKSRALVNQLLAAVFNEYNEVLRVSSVSTIRKLHTLYRAVLSSDLEGQVNSFLNPATPKAVIKTTSAVPAAASAVKSSVPPPVPVASKLNDLYKVFLKDDCFLPEFVEVFTETKVIFRNEDRCTHLVECRGNLLFQDLVIPSRGEKSFVFALPGRYELSGQNKAGMRCIVEVKHREMQPSGGRAVYFPTAKDRERAASAVASADSLNHEAEQTAAVSVGAAGSVDKENSSTVVNGSSEEGLGGRGGVGAGSAASEAASGLASRVPGGPQQSAASKGKNAGSKKKTKNGGAAAGGAGVASASNSCNQVLRVNSSSEEEHQQQRLPSKDEVAAVRSRVMMTTNGKKPTSASQGNGGKAAVLPSSSSNEDEEQEEAGNLKMQRLRMKASSSSAASSARTKSQAVASNGSLHQSETGAAAVPAPVGGKTISTPSLDKRKTADGSAKQTSPPQLSSLSSAAAVSTAAPPKRVIRVWIQDYSFSQEQVTVVAGQTVEFKLAMDVPNHAEHSLIGTSSNPALRFESGLLQQPQTADNSAPGVGHCASYSFIPTVPGEVLVSCAIYTDMQCLVTVISLNGHHLTAGSSTRNGKSTSSSTDKKQGEGAAAGASVSFQSKVDVRETSAISAVSVGAVERPTGGESSCSSSASPSASPAEKKVEEMSLSVGHFTTTSRSSGGRRSFSSSAAESSGQSSFYDSDDVFSDEVLSEEDERGGHGRAVAAAPFSSVAQRLAYGTAGSAGSDPPAASGGVKRHFINVEEFKFQPTSLVIRVNEEVLFRLLPNNGSNLSSSSSSAVSGVTLSCEGEFDEIRLRPSSSGGLEASSFYLHRFSSVGAFEVKNDIFRFVGCHILVSAMEFASSGAVCSTSSPPSYKSGSSSAGPPRLMGSFPRFNGHSGSGAGGAVTTAAPPVPVFNRPIISEEDDVNDPLEEKPENADADLNFTSTQQPQQLSPQVTRVMASADFSCDIDSSGSDPEEENKESRRVVSPPLSAPATAVAAASQSKLCMSELVVAEPSPAPAADQKTELCVRPPSAVATGLTSAPKNSRSSVEAAALELMVSDIVGSMLSGHPLGNSHITKTGVSQASTGSTGTVVLLEGRKTDAPPPPPPAVVVPPADASNPQEEATKGKKKKKNKKKKKKKPAASAGGAGGGGGIAEPEEEDEEEEEDEIAGGETERVIKQRDEEPLKDQLDATAIATEEAEVMPSPVEPLVEPAKPVAESPAVEEKKIWPLDELPAEWREAIAAADLADYLEASQLAGGFEKDQQEEKKGGEQREEEEFVSKKNKKNKKNKKTTTSTLNESPGTAATSGIVSASPAPLVATTPAPASKTVSVPAVVPSAAPSTVAAGSTVMPTVKTKNQKNKPEVSSTSTKNASKSAPVVAPVSVAVLSEAASPLQGSYFDFPENESDKAVMDFLRKRLELIESKSHDVLPSGRKVKVVHLIIAGKK